MPSIAASVFAPFTSSLPSGDGSATAQPATDVFGALLGVATPAEPVTPGDVKRPTPSIASLLATATAAVPTPTPAPGLEVARPVTPTIDPDKGEEANLPATTVAPPRATAPVTAQVAPAPPVPIRAATPDTTRPVTPITDTAKKGEAKVSTPTTIASPPAKVRVGVALDAARPVTPTVDTDKQGETARRTTIAPPLTDHAASARPAAAVPIRVGGALDTTRPVTPTTDTGKRSDAGPYITTIASPVAATTAVTPAAAPATPISMAPAKGPQDVKLPAATKTTPGLPGKVAEAADTDVQAIDPDAKAVTPDAVSIAPSSNAPAGPARPSRDAATTSEPASEPDGHPLAEPPVSWQSTPHSIPATPTSAEHHSDADRPDGEVEAADVPEIPLIPVTVTPLPAIPLPATPVAPVASPPVAIDAAVTATDTRSAASTATPAPKVRADQAAGRSPIAPDPILAPIGTGDRTPSSGYGSDAPSHHAAAPADPAGATPPPRDGAAPFIPAAPLASAMTADRAVPAAPGAITAQPGRIGHELGVAIAHHVARGDATGGGDTITLRLNPVDMGRIEVKLSFDDGGMLRALVSADNPAALDMLRRDSADLGRALVDAGVRADTQTLRFDTRAGTGQGGNHGGSGQPWQRQSGSADTTPDVHTADDITAAYRPLRTRGRVDMVA